MGGSHSARKLSVENENDPSTVIKVSENVVQRIRSGAAAEAESEFRKQKHQEVEDELQKNNQYWERRIACLQESHQKINQIMEEEYIKSVEDMKRQLPRIPPEHAKLPCQDKKGMLLTCYKMYPKRPLLCAQEVEAFNCCMKNERIRVMNAK
nr:uncharacterized protein LOC106683872 isoform X2 [Halyomorpha halys]